MASGNRRGRLNKLKKKIRVTKAGKKSDTKTKPADGKKRVFGRRVRFERTVIKNAKHGPQRKTMLEMTRSRRAMEAHLADGVRLSPNAVSTAMNATMTIIDQVTDRVALLLKFVGKRTADERMLKLAIHDTLKHRGYFGLDLAMMEQFVYEDALPVYVESKGRTSAERLSKAFELGMEAA